jgi:Condensation domain
MTLSYSHDRPPPNEKTLDASAEDVFVFPMSFAQQRIWFLEQLAPLSPVYNIPRGLRLTGSLNVAALEQSLNEIVRRHEALRTTFGTVDLRPKKPSGRST